MDNQNALGRVQSFKGLGKLVNVTSGGDIQPKSFNASLKSQSIHDSSQGSYELKMSKQSNSSPSVIRKKFKGAQKANQRNERQIIEEELTMGDINEIQQRSQKNLQTIDFYSN